jgi:hypothetical protein
MYLFSYYNRINLKPLNKNKYSQELISRAYVLYLKDFKEQGFKGQRYSLYSFETHAPNRDLFLHKAIQEQRDKKINKILNGSK